MEAISPIGRKIPVKRWNEFPCGSSVPKHMRLLVVIALNFPLTFECNARCQRKLLEESNVETGVSHRNKTNHLQMLYMYINFPNEAE